VMAIVMIKITCADVIGMAGIAAARKKTFSTAHTAGVEIQNIKTKKYECYFIVQIVSYNITTDTNGHFV